MHRQMVGFAAILMAAAVAAAVLGAYSTAISLAATSVAMLAFARWSPALREPRKQGRPSLGLEDDRARMAFARNAASRYFAMTGATLLLAALAATANGMYRTAIWVVALALGLLIIAWAIARRAPS